MITHTTLCDSPLGPLLLTSDGIAMTGLYLKPTGDLIRGAGAARGDDVTPFAAARVQLAAYFAGQLREFDLPLAPRGTPFQQRVWAALREIPYGSTLSYGEVARRIGHPGGARAVGLANGSNPIAIIVPCHRVIGSNGRLVGYGGGLENKQALLAMEAAVAAGQRSFSFPAPSAAAR